MRSTNKSCSGKQMRSIEAWRRGMPMRRCNRRRGIEGRRRSSCSNYSKVVRKVEERLVGRRRLRVRLVAEEGQRVRLAVEHLQRHRQRLGKLLLSAHQRARAVAHSATPLRSVTPTTQQVAVVVAVPLAPHRRSVRHLNPALRSGLTPRLAPHPLLRLQARLQALRLSVALPPAPPRRLSEAQHSAPHQRQHRPHSAAQQLLVTAPTLPLQHSAPPLAHHSTAQLREDEERRWMTLTKLQCRKERI